MAEKYFFPTPEKQLGCEQDIQTARPCQIQIALMVERQLICGINKHGVK